MYDGTQEECDESSGVLVDFHRGDGGVVDVAEEEVVNWTVPIACELIPRYTVPPVCIEPTIREVGEFCKKVQDTLPDNVPSLR
jgi:hypothetical protein